MAKDLAKSPGQLDPGRFYNIDCLPESPQFMGMDHNLRFQTLLEKRGSYEDARVGINEMMFIAHGSSYMRGWWHDKDTGVLLDQEYQVPIKLALIHSEISEALEGDRKGVTDDHLPHRPAIEVELADALLRIFDLAAAKQLDLAGAFVEKAQYNARRKDHSAEARQGEQGKTY